MVAHFVDGGHHFEWMSIGEVNKIRDRSPAAKKDASPWITDYEQMALKTVIRRGWKYLPMSIEMQNHERIETANETGQKVSFTVEGDAVEITTQAAEQTEAPDLKTMISNAKTLAGLEFIHPMIGDLDDVAQQDELLMAWTAKKDAIA